MFRKNPVCRGWWDLVLGEPGRVVLTELGVTGLLGGDYQCRSKGEVKEEKRRSKVQGAQGVRHLLEEPVWAVLRAAHPAGGAGQAGGHHHTIYSSFLFPPLVAPDLHVTWEGLVVSNRREHLEGSGITMNTSTIGNMTTEGSKQTNS